ncbi:hypothetical protein B4U79_07586, partial [Dinothrombium tinctorium]
MAENDFPVAVIGIACRLPRAENSSQFWEFICEKRDANGDLPAERAKDLEHLVRKMDPENFVNANSPFFTGCFFESIDKFDANFFGISPEEAQYIDPQQRFFLRTAWEAIEDAGIAASIFGSETGVYIGYPEEKYLEILPHINRAAALGTHPPFIAARLSYTLNLRGPSFLVNAACSASLVAAHVACEGLKNGDCKIAIAGGVTIDCLPICVKSNIWNLAGFVKQGAQCRPFDDNAEYMVIGEGSAAIVMKPLQDAISDGNHIYGVICSSVVNQNGLTNGLSTPHPGGQCDLLVSAWNKAAIKPDQIGYFEAHASGTKLGDTIEACGIQMAFDRFKSKKAKRNANKAYIGSVKANFGDLGEGAAGIISLIKVLLAFHHNQIPPQTNFDTPSGDIDWKRFPFRVNTQKVEWRPERGQARVAAVSSLGDASTNVHFVVQDFKQQTEDNFEDSVENLEPILISAATQKSLFNFILKMKEFISNFENRESNVNAFKNIAYTLNIGREQRKFAFKILLFAENLNRFEQVLNRICEQTNNLQHFTDEILPQKEFEKRMTNDRFLCFL